MEGVLFIIFVVFAIAIVALVVSHQRRANLLAVYQQLARRFGGHAEPGGMLAFPTATFMHNDTWVSVDVFSTGGRNSARYTQVHFYWQQPALRCEIYPEGYWTRLGKFFGVQDIEIGSTDFDHEFVVKGNHPAAVRRFLSLDVQWKIQQLRRMLGNNDIYISFGGHELLVKKLSLIRDYNTLAEFVTATIELFDQMAMVDEPGIEFVETAQKTEPVEAVCQVCGDKIVSAAVLCRRCRTPHHEDCWRYNGACSIYGCQETKFIPDKSARGAPPPVPPSSTRRPPVLHYRPGQTPDQRQWERECPQCGASSHTMYARGQCPFCHVAADP